MHPAEDGALQRLPAASVAGGKQGPWHASLQAAGSTRRVGFPDVEHLMAYLIRLTAADPDHSAGPDAPEPDGPRRVAEEEPHP